MKSKSTLSLIELTIMLLVFALASALCLKAFALSGQLARANDRRDLAVNQAQNVAELLQHHHGDLQKAAKQYGGRADTGSWTICYDEQWRQTDREGLYILTVQSQPSGGEGSPVSLCGTGLIRVESAGGDELFSMTAAWQEVAQ